LVVFEQFKYNYNSYHHEVYYLCVFCCTVLFVAL